MPAPYSLDLRWRIVELHFVENKTKRSIARHLRISMSTVHRILQRLAEYGHVRPARIGRPDIAALLTRAQLLVLMEHVLNNPTSYLKEMEQYLIDSTGSSSNLVGLHRILRHNGYSYKRDRGVTRNYGYNVRGQIATGRYVNPRSPRVTSISAVSYDGLIAAHMTRKTLNGRRFKRFLRNEIAPQLQPYNGVNDRSVVVMDNHAAHHVAGVEEIVEATGALLLYLPPYCPELNPIEGVFSIVKGWLRANDLMFLITPDPQEMILRGFFHVTRSDVQSLYTHCGYS
ncbi:uncharacterized protein [Montipora foliosa]|uniref:uncharacterized protein n=1 Tax=Montipora foliosa TaxID=591990 RepID=UPI0035F1D996